MSKYPSFQLEEKVEALNYFNEKGFVVFRNIYSSAECHSSRSCMENYVEKTNPGLIIQDPITWDSFKSTGKYGLSSRGPCFEKQLVMNRQHIRLIEAISCILEIPAHDIIVSHDRFTIYRATQLEAWNIYDGDKYRTGRKNIHLDMNPWWHMEDNIEIRKGIESIKYSESQDLVRENNMIISSMGRHIQCVLNFADNNEEDGGTIVVPEFHHTINDWCQEYSKYKKNVPWVEFPNQMTDVESKLLDQSIRIPMEEGSILIWDQRVAHGTSPNFSPRCRYAQFIKACSRRQSFLSDEILFSGTSIDTSTSSSSSSSSFSFSFSYKDKKTYNNIMNEKNIHVEHTMSHYTSIDVTVPVYKTARLIRRALLLQSLLKSQGVDIYVTSLGKQVFGLDVLDD